MKLSYRIRCLADAAHDEGWKFISDQLHSVARIAENEEKEEELAREAENR